MTVRITVVLLTFFITPYVLNGLGKEMYGLNSLMLQTVGYLGLADFGLGKAIHIAYYKALSTKNNNKINIVFNSANNIYLFISAMILILGLTLCFFLEYFFQINPELVLLSKYVFVIYAIKSAVSYVFGSYQSLIISDQKQYKLGFINLFFRPLYVISNGLVIYFGGLLLELVICSLIISLIFEFIKYIVIRRNYPFLKKTNKTRHKALLKTSFYVLIDKIVKLSYKRLDFILIGIYLSLSDVASFAIYMTFSLILERFYISAITPIQPGIGNLIHKKEIKKIKDLFKDMITTVFFFQILICSALIFFLQSFVINWVGEDMLINGNFIYFFVMVIFIKPLLIVNNSFIDAKDLFKKKMYGSIIEISLNVLVSIFLVKSFGVLGLIVGTLTGYLLMQIWYVPYIFNRSFKISSLYYFIEVLKYFLFFFINILVLSFFFEIIVDYTSVQSSWLSFIYYFSIFITLSLIINVIVFFLFDKNFKFILNRFKQIFFQIKKIFHGEV